MRICLSLVLLAALPGFAGDRITELGWMEGTWTSVVDGTTMSEVWTSPSGGVMLGLHRDVGDGKVTFEFLRIVQKDDTVVYVAQPGGGPATSFPLLESTPGRVVFENLDHDFPQRIIYWKEDSSLCARVEGPMRGEVVTMEWCWAREKD